MRIAEAAGLERVDIDIKFGLVRVAVKDGLIGRGLAGRIAPFELVGRHVGDGRRIEFGGAAGDDKAESCSRNRKCKMRQNAAIGHFSLPYANAFAARMAPRSFSIGADVGATLVVARFAHSVARLDGYSGHAWTFSGFSPSAGSRATTRVAPTSTAPLVPDHVITL